MTGTRPVSNRATVEQPRNERDLTRDFSLDVVGYERTRPLLEALTRDAETFFAFLPGLSK